jgi:alkylation response protein AidB-like acyl-CoA dehydrogenase
MYNLHLSAEQLEFRDTVRGFVNDEIKPVTLNAQRLDLGDRSLPKAEFAKASQMGLRTLALPEELGGVGADALTRCIVTEELAAGDADIAAVLSETSNLGGVLFPTMTAQQRERFLPAFLADDSYHLARGCREPGDDSALGINYHRPAAEMRCKTTALRNGNDWVISGTKDFVANAPIAKLFAIEAQTDKGLALILVPAGMAGLTVTEQAEPRWYHGSAGRIDLKGCRVPAENLLSIGGSSGFGGEGLGRGIPTSAALALGIGRAAYEAALEYAALRVQGGRPIVQHQAVGTKLADIAIRLEVARNAIWQAAWASDHPGAFADRSLSDLPLSTVAQVFATEAIYRAVKDSAECFGAMGVMRDMPLWKYIHDARICLNSGDGNADARLRIAEAIAGYRRTPAMHAAE